MAVATWIYEKGGIAGAPPASGVAPSVTSATATIYYSDSNGNVQTYPGDTDATDYGFKLSFDLPTDMTHLQSLQVYATSENGWRNPGPILDVPVSFLTTDPVVDLPTSHWTRPEADQTFQKLQFYSINEIGQPSAAVEYTGGGPPSTLKVLGRPATTGGPGGGVAPDPVTAVTVTILEVGIDATTSEAKQHLKVSYTPPAGWATNPADIIYAYLQRGTGPNSSTVTWAPINVDPNDSAADNAGANGNSISMWVPRPTPNSQWARVFVTASRSDFIVFLDVTTDPVSAVFTLAAESAPHPNDITDATLGSVQYLQRDDGSWYWAVDMHWTNPTLTTDIEFLLTHWTVKKVHNTTGAAAPDREGTERYGNQWWGIGEVVNDTLLGDIPLPPYNRYQFRLYVTNDRNAETLESTAWSGQPYGYVDVDHTPGTPVQTVTGATLSAISFPQRDDGSFYGTVTITATAPTLQADPAFLLMKITVQQTDVDGHTATVGGAGWTEEQREREIDEQWIAGAVLKNTLLFTIPSDTLPDGAVPPNPNPYIYLQFRVRVVNSDGVETVQNAWTDGSGGWVNAARINARTGAPTTVVNLDNLNLDPTLRVKNGQLGSTTPNNDSLASNSYFEEGDLTGWTEDGGNNHISIDNAHSKSGVYCLKTIPIPGNTLLVVRNDLWVPVAPGETYFVSVDAAAGPGADGVAGASAGVYDHNRAIYTSGEQHFYTPNSGPTPPSPAFTYVNLHSTFTVPATVPSGLKAAWMRITLIVYNYTAGNWYLDNAVLQSAANSNKITSVDGGVVNIGSITSDKIGSINGAVIDVGTIGANSIGSVKAVSINIGKLIATQIDTISATSITGTLTSANVGRIDVSSITGTLYSTNIARIDATAIAGALTAGQIGAVNASSITGTLTAMNVGKIDVGALVGSLTAANVANINATSITGVIVTNQIADQILNTMTKFSDSILGPGLAGRDSGQLQLGTQDTQNMASNPGFEFGFKDWQVSASVFLDTSNQHSGSNCARISVANQYIVGGIPNRVPNTGGGIPCKPGDSFVYQIYYKSVGGSGNIAILFQFWSAAGANVGQPAVSLGPTGGVYQMGSTGIQTAPAGAAYLQYHIFTGGLTGGTWYIDDVLLLHGYDSTMISSVNANVITGSISGPSVTVNASTIVGLITGVAVQVDCTTFTGAINAARITSINISAIADGDITTQKLHDLAITNAKIDNATITSSQIANLTITGNKIAAATISVDKLVTTSIDVGGGLNKPGKINVFDALSAILGEIGTLSGGVGYGGWFRQFGAGGTAYSNAKVYTDTSGNLTIKDANFSVTSGTGFTVATSPTTFDSTYASLAMNVYDASDKTAHISRGLIVYNASHTLGGLVRHPTNVSDLQLVMYNLSGGITILIDGYDLSGTPSGAGRIRADIFQAGGSPGVSGSFTTANGKTVTVTGGLITNIV